MQIVPAGRPADLIAHAWYRIGYPPTDSLVLVGLFPGRGGRLTGGAVLRVDVPPRRETPTFLDTLMRTLVRTGHHAVFAVVPARRGAPAGRSGSARPPVSGPCSRPWLDRAVQAAARRARLTVTDVIGVDDASFRSYLCTDDDCCPPAGRPLQDVLTSSAALAHVLDGQVLAGSEDDLVADVAAAADPLVAEGLLAGRSAPGPEETLALWEDLVGRYPAPVTATELADLCLALEVVLLRDAVLACAVHPAGPAGPCAARAVLSGDGAAVFAALDRITPEDGRVRRVRAVLSAVARHAPAGRRAGALSMLGWLMWWAGDGLCSRRYAEAAQHDVPGHRLAGLVLSVLEATMPPAWAGPARRDLTRALPAP